MSLHASFENVITYLYVFILIPRKSFVIMNNFCSFILQLAREVLDVAAMMVKPGVTTEEIDHAVHLVRIL